MKKDRKMTRKKKKKSKKGRKKINVKFLLFLIGLASGLVCIVCLSREEYFFAFGVLTIGMLLAFPYIAEDYEEYENLTLVTFYEYCACVIICIVFWIIFFAYEIKELLTGG